MVSNAIKFTQHGEVSIKVEPLKTKKGKQAHSNEVDLHFQVVDTGIGISREQQSKVFEKFSQADNSTTRKYGGTGLGLSISRSLVEMMGGRMWLKSKAGAGSAFQFNLRLPVVTGQDITVVEYGYPDFNNILVLVVDDNATNRFILQKSLSAWGMKVWEAANGYEAVELLNNGQISFNLAILDHQMPEMDGMELARIIRKELNHPDLKIVILSSLQRISSQLQKELGISLAITKPVKQSKLFDTLLQVLRFKKKTPVTVVNQEAVTPLPQPGRHNRLLVVEDNHDNQNLTRKILEKAGFAVDLAGNGKLAVDAAKKFRYDLILMDIQMPVMDGFDATKNIREIERSLQESRAPILALTAHAFEGYREKCLLNEMDDYITKPIKKKILLEAIDKWIDPRPLILITDDSEENRLLIKIHLQKTEAYRLIFAENGQEAVEQFKRQKCSLILMDMEMPVQNGYEATAAIRQLEHGQEIPIIALTAHKGVQEKNRCLQAGCNEFLSKPIRKQKLLEMIGRFIDTSEKMLININ